MTHSSLDAATQNLFDSEIPFEESQEIYKKWALDHSYDQMINDQTVYTAPPRLTAKMVELFGDRRHDALVLDIGAGTGLIAQWLQKAGFTRFHALEPLKEFVDLAVEKKVYDKIFHQGIGMGCVLDTPDDTYDAVVAAGAYGPGSIPSDSFYEIVRVIKKGGYFVNCMRREYLWNTLIYKDILEPLAEQLEREGKWERVTWDAYDNHYQGNQGLMMVFRIL